MYLHITNFGISVNIFDVILKIKSNGDSDLIFLIVIGYYMLHIQNSGISIEFSLGFREKMIVFRK
jgi:hypothetical protein